MAVNRPRPFHKARPKILCALAAAQVVLNLPEGFVDGLQLRGQLGDLLRCQERAVAGGGQHGQFAADIAELSLVLDSFALDLQDGDPVHQFSRRHLDRNGASPARGRPSCQFLGHALEHVFPLSRSRLPEETYRRVPG